MEPRENEVRERIPVPHDNYFQSFFSSRHAARVISEFCSHDRAVWFHVPRYQLSQLAVCAAWTWNVVSLKSSIFPVY